MHVPHGVLIPGPNYVESFPLARAKQDDGNPTILKIFVCCSWLLLLYHACLITPSLSTVRQPRHNSRRASSSSSFCGVHGLRILSVRAFVGHDSCRTTVESMNEHIEPLKSPSVLGWYIPGSRGSTIEFTQMFLRLLT